MANSKEKTCYECIFYYDGEWAGAVDFPVNCSYLGALVTLQHAENCRWFFNRDKALDIIIKQMR